MTDKLKKKASSSWQQAEKHRPLQTVSEQSMTGIILCEVMSGRFQMNE